MPNPVTVPFGRAGSMTVRANEAGAVVRAAAGEHVICTVTVTGGRPTFTFAREGVVLQDSATLQPAIKYQWILSAADGTLSPGEATYTFAVGFIGAFKYVYMMEHCDEFGARIQMLKDIDYESADAEDRRFEPILIELR
jgi:hypothetical protein